MASARNTEYVPLESKPSSNPPFEFSLSQLLKDNPLRIILTPKQLLIVNARENVGTLLQKLRECSLRCAVVYDSEKLFVGFVDVLDICTHILDVTNWRNDLSVDSFKNLLWEGQNFVSEDSGQLINISQGNPFEAVNPDMPLIDAVRLMARGIYRLPVIENGLIVNIVSQWDILLMVCSRISLLGPQFERQLKDTTIGSSFSLAIPDNLDGVLAVKFLFDNQIAGAPVVDENGRTISSFSATDLLNLTAETFPLLSLSVRDYLLRTYGYLKPPVCCKVTDTVENVILKMLSFKIHRVYCVDDQLKPMGVISLTDIMKFLLSTKMDPRTQD